MTRWPTAAANAGERQGLQAVAFRLGVARLFTLGQLARMKIAAPFWSLLLERFVACVLLVGVLPALLFIGFFIYSTSGRPVLIADELPGINGVGVRSLRFRTTGHGEPFFRVVGRHLRAYNLDEVPGLWSVMRGDIRLRDFLRLTRCR